MFDVFGAEMPLAVRFFLAFLIVLGLIGATAWAVRRFGGGRLSSTTRGRQPRLAVIDYASVDARRRLILVRRDNVEHLLMIGGPTDVVVEPNIVRATPAARDVPSARPPVAADALPRVIPLPEAPSNGSWPLQPEPAGPPLPPAPPRRAPRVEPIQEEPRNFPPPPPLPEAPPRPQREALAALAEDLAAGPVPPLLPRNRPAGPVRPQPNEQRAEARSEPRLPAPSADPEAPSAVDQNLAEMAQRLEAALRKPKSTEAREAPTLSPPASAPPPPPVVAPTSPPPIESAAVAEEAAEPPASPTPGSPPPLPRATRPAEARPPRPAPKAKEGKAIYDTLEQEMASLLGRPPGKTN
jgi:flagellar protein FliO/FliZ